MKHFRFITIALMIVTLVFLGIGISAQQVQIKGKPDKPPGKDKPPIEDPCEDNSICDLNETLECPDCQFAPLNMTGAQIVMASGNSTEAIARIYQLKFNSGIYENTWVSEQLPTSSMGGISIGDADNDGFDEITAIVKKEGKGKKYVKIYMYKSGSTGTDAYISQDLEIWSDFIFDSIIADADSDGLNELIVAVSNRIEIYKWDGAEFARIWTSRNYPDTIFSVDVGDPDNDGINEIVLAPFSVGSAVILETIGNDEWGDEQLTESIPEEFWNLNFLAIDYAKVRNADNLAGNEIVAGGNNNRLMIWKYDELSGIYDTVFISEDLGGFTQGVDVGDIDGDDLNEVITLATKNSTIYRFDYTGTTYTKSTLNTGFPLSYLAVGNIDNDVMDEIVVRGFDLGILEFVGDTLGWTLMFPYSGKFEILE